MYKFLLDMADACRHNSTANNSKHSPTASLFLSLCHVSPSIFLHTREKTYALSAFLSNSPRHMTKSNLKQFKSKKKKFLHQ